MVTWTFQISRLKNSNLILMEAGKWATLLLFIPRSAVAAGCVRSAALFEI
jgi:hypothetical protein